MSSKYTSKQKIEALKLVEANGLRATERQLGIPRKTLGCWKRDYTTIKATNDEEVETVKELGEVLVTTKEDLFDQHMIEYIPKAIKFKDMCLSKLQKLVGKADKPEHIHAVAGAYKIIHDSITPKVPVNLSVDNSKTQNNFHTVAEVINEKYREGLKD